MIMPGIFWPVMAERSVRLCLGCAFLPAPAFAKWSVLSNIPACLACILLGACAEATIFRIAKFDELDFCNQSLGAVLAVLVALAIVPTAKPAEFEFDLGLIVGIAFLAREAALLSPRIYAAAVLGLLASLLSHDKRLDCDDTVNHSARAGGNCCGQTDAP